MKDSQYLYFWGWEIDKRMMKRESMRKAGNKKRCEDQDYIIYTQTNKRHKITKKYISTGEWSTKDNQIYLSFLESHRSMFESQFVRRSTKVFRKMSTLLRRRDSEQCRSHHQKLSLKYNGDISAIISNLRAKIIKQQENQIINQNPLFQAPRPTDEEAHNQSILKVKVEGKQKQKALTGLNNNINYIDGYQINTEYDGEIQIFIDIHQAGLW